VTDNGITAQLAFAHLRNRFAPGSIMRLARDLDLLLVPVDIDFTEFQTVNLLESHRTSGAYTHLLLDSGNENNLTPLYQVGVAASDLTIVCLNYNGLPEHPLEKQVHTWIAERAPRISPPPSTVSESRQRWIHEQVGRLLRQMGPAAVQGRVLFGPQVWDSAYEPALGWLAFDAWTTTHKRDEWAYPLWTNMGRPLRDDVGSIAYLGEVADSVKEVLGDRDYLGLPDRAHRTAVLGYDVEGDTRWWGPIARRLSAASPVTVLNTAIPYFPDEGPPFHQTATGRKTYRQAAINLDQLTGHRRKSSR
jgi:hypothetical protein